MGSRPSMGSGFRKSRDSHPPVPCSGAQRRPAWMTANCENPHGVGPPPWGLVFEVSPGGASRALSEQTGEGTILLTVLTRFRRRSQAET